MRVSGDDSARNKRETFVLVFPMAALDDTIDLLLDAKDVANGPDHSGTDHLWTSDGIKIAITNGQFDTSWSNVDRDYAKAMEWIFRRCEILEPTQPYNKMGGMDTWEIQEAMAAEGHRIGLRRLFNCMSVFRPGIRQFHTGVGGRVWNLRLREQPAISEPPE